MMRFQAEKCVAFRKVNEEFGALGNMSRMFPVNCNSEHFITSEHLYIALRFSGFSDFQKEIQNHKNALWCKKTYVNDKYKQYHYSDWQNNCVEIMKYVLKLKYQQNAGFRELLEKTGDRYIIEDVTFRRKGIFWGARLKEGYFEGYNTLGNILMELRDKKGEIELRLPEDLTLFDKKIVI